MRLDPFALDDIRIDRALREEIDVLEFAGLLFENADEFASDDFALCFRIGNIGQLVEEAVGGVDVDEICVHLVTEDLDDLFAFTLAHEAVVDMHADKLFADCLDEQSRDNRAVDSAREREQNLAVADLFADEINLFFDELIRKFFRGDADHVFGSFI